MGLKLSKKMWPGSDSISGSGGMSISCISERGRLEMGRKIHGLNMENFFNLLGTFSGTYLRNIVNIFIAVRCYMYVAGLCSHQFSFPSPSSPSHNL